MSQRGPAYASFFLRITLGVCFCVHGWPKVAELFGKGDWPSYGVEPAWLFAIGVAFGEALAGTAMLIGVFHKLAALVIIVIMVGAIWTVHGKNGYSIQGKGFEYNVALIAMALSVFLTGPGAYAYQLKKKEH